MDTLSAIPIREPWIDLILHGVKTWEIRSKFTKKIGPVGLIRVGSKTVVATATLSEVILLTPKLAYENQDKMGYEGMPKKAAADFAGNYAWVLKDIVPLKTPVPYIHKSQVVWVTLDEPTTKKVLEEAKRSRKK